MRVQVNENVCQGHSLCSWTAPEIFAPDDEDGHAIVALDVIPPELEQSARDAAANCPESAITILPE
jgi:ferredoxin